MLLRICAKSNDTSTGKEVIDNNYIIKFFYIFCVIHLSSSCYIAKNNGVLTCTTPAEISAEGTADWKKLYLFPSRDLVVTVKKNAFKRSPNLEDLTLFRISYIDPGALDGLSKLDKISFFDARIEEIPTGVLDNLSIRNLQILKTKFKTIQQGFFNNLPDISFVDIRNNSLTTIQKGVFDSTPIFKLYLSGNQIDKIDDKAFEKMDDLIYLNLHGNLLDSFNSEQYLGTSNSLNQLWLSKNKLTKITKDTVGTIPNLNNLYLELNQIETIEPGSFTNNKHLLFLDVSNNKLKTIEPNIFPSTTELYYLAIHNNRLTYINKALFVRLRVLRFITYGGNPLQCPCNDEIDDSLKRKNVSRVCDTDYYNGERPSCLYTSESPKECLYDADITKDLYENYQTALGDYPQIHLKCDTTKGIPHGFLNHVELV